MVQFNAGTAVEKMDYDFTAFGGGKGTIPEPSTGAVQTFFDTIREMAKDVQALSAARDQADKGDLSDAEAAEVISSMDDNAVEQYQNTLNTSIAELCQNAPPLQEIEALPYRVLSAFTAWLMEQLRPEAKGPATRR